MKSKNLLLLSFIWAESVRKFETAGRKPAQKKRKREKIKRNEQLFKSNNTNRGSIVMAAPVSQPASERDRHQRRSCSPRSVYQITQPHCIGWPLFIACNHTATATAVNQWEWNYGRKSCVRKRQFSMRNIQTKHGKKRIHLFSIKILVLSKPHKRLQIQQFQWSWSIRSCQTWHVKHFFKNWILHSNFKHCFVFNSKMKDRKFNSGTKRNERNENECTSHICDNQASFAHKAKKNRSKWIVFFWNLSHELHSTLKSK